MDSKRLTEWLSSAEGSGKALLAFVGIVASIWTASGSLTSMLGLSGRWPFLFGGGGVILFGAIVWRSYRGSTPASRLEKPELFTLRPTGPEDLIGRVEDLEKLTESVRRNRIVLLDGESGCGKSALAAAGLVPRLKASGEFIPVLVREWGEDWVRGPLSASTGALFEAIDPESKEVLEWSAPPDQAASIETLLADLKKRLSAVFERLSRRSLLIADQFDDYEASHRARFLDGTGNWLSPAVLAEKNPFWSLVRECLDAGSMHLLVITRSDSAAGLACVRFLDGQLIAARSLTRVDAGFLRPLLDGLAPPEAVPLIVSNPNGGWVELRDRFEADLKAEGSVLMQQVRTGLLGLRRLSTLTVTKYRQAGGLQGVETLHVERAIEAAAARIGGSTEQRGSVRALLAELILPGSPNQPAKARMAAFGTLERRVGSPDATRKVLESLQQDEIVRPGAPTGAGEETWQLDHDYLARGVLGESRRADRWAMALREGRAKYERAGGSLRQKWAALLPITTFIRVCWERFRRRLVFGNARSYALASGVKPFMGMAMAASFAVGIGWIQAERKLSSDAERLVADLANYETSEAAVVEIWRSPEPLRRRVYEHITSPAFPNRLRSALKTRWLLAHLGVEVRDAEQAMRALPMEGVDNYASLAGLVRRFTNRSALLDLVRRRLAISKGSLEGYGLLLTLVTNQDVVAEEGLLRKMLIEEGDPGLVSPLASAYAIVAARVSEPELQNEAGQALFDRLVKEKNPDTASALAWAYAALAERISDEKLVGEAAKHLLERFVKEKRLATGSALAGACAALARCASDQKLVDDLARGLSDRQAEEKDPQVASGLVTAYAALAERVSDQSRAIEMMETALLGWSDMAESWPGPLPVARAYVAIAARGGEKGRIGRVVARLRDRLGHATHVRFQTRTMQVIVTKGSLLPAAYAILVTHTNNQMLINGEARALRDKLVRRKRSSDIGKLARSYASVAGRVADQEPVNDKVQTWRDQFAEGTDIDVDISDLAEAYAAVVGCVTDQGLIKEDVQALRDVLSGPNRSNHERTYFAQAYAAVVARTTDQDLINAEALALGEELARRRDRSLATAYAAVVDRATEEGAIEGMTDVLREFLEAETDSASVREYSRAYGAVAARLLSGVGSGEGRTRLVAETLTLAGHPILDDPPVLLRALKSETGATFETGDIAAAVAWAQRTYGIRTADLRPGPRSSGDGRSAGRSRGSTPWAMEPAVPR